MKKKKLTGITTLFTAMCIAAVPGIHANADVSMEIDTSKNCYEEVNSMVELGELDKNGSESEGHIIWKDGDIVRKVVTYPSDSDNYMKDYTAEYYYDENERLLFAFAKSDSEEYRCYYDGNGYLYRYINAEKETEDYDDGWYIDKMLETDMPLLLYYGSEQYVEYGDVKNIVGKIDNYTYNLMVDSSAEKTQSDFVEEMNDEFENFGEEAKLAIATNSISYEHAADEIEADEISGQVYAAPDTVRQYTNLFKTEPDLENMEQVDISDYDDFYAGHYGRTAEGNIFVAYGLGEDDVKEDSSFISASENDDGGYTVTKKYNFYSHWSHETPDYIVEATIQLKPNSESIYGYNITSITYQ